MADRTAEFREVRTVGVAGCALVPGAGMCPRIDGEKIAIVGKKLRRCPARINGMASRTVVPKPCCLVVWCFCVFEMLLVAGVAIRGRHGEITAGMAGRTIVDFMALFQRKKAVVNHIGTPVRIVNAVALDAIGGKAGFSMVWIGSPFELFQMAGNTIVPDTLIPQR